MGLVTVFTYPSARSAFHASTLLAHSRPASAGLRGFGLFALGYKAEGPCQKGLNNPLTGSSRAALLWDICLLPQK